jgi:hypothetical protein
MAIGKAVDKASVDSLAASYARNFTQLLNDEGFAEFGQAVLTLSDAALIALGYTQAEVNTLKAFVNQMNTLIAAYNAANAGRFFARQLYGLYNG